MLKLGLSKSRLAVFCILLVAFKLYSVAAVALGCSIRSCSLFFGEIAELSIRGIAALTSFSGCLNPVDGLPAGVGAGVLVG